MSTLHFPVKILAKLFYINCRYKSFKSDSPEHVAKALRTDQEEKMNALTRSLTVRPARRQQAGMSPGGSSSVRVRVLREEDEEGGVDEVGEGGKLLWKRGVNKALLNKDSIKRQYEEAKQEFKPPVSRSHSRNE